MKTGSHIFLVLGVFLAMGMGCTSYTIPDKNSNTVTANSCEGCHTDYERLIAVHSPDTVEPVGGCGGAAPHYEPYDRVYLGGDGFEAFKSSGHYGIGCTGCHNGVGDTGEKEEAHSGDWIKSPSLAYADKCATCHQDVTDNFTTSLHNGTGQKRKVAIRAGLSGPDEFDQLPAHQIEGYEAKCAICHGTCGNCHVVRPAIAGGGLTKGHNFIETPDWYNVCVSCHVSRGGHAFLGVAAEPDYHRDELDFDCLSCHDGHEVHGDGQPVEQRYAYTELPKCEDCHEGLARENNYHTMHYDDFQCQICHSQEYNTCGACHIKDGHAEIESHMEFKIGVNPLPDLKDYDLALVRRTLAHPDNWVGYGEDLAYENFDALPTYNYTTPHNILRWTAQTQVEGGQNCSSNCHIRNEGGTLINSELYLFESDLYDWDLEATSGVAVDGELPAYWFTEK
ncbi:MAG: hypothetical protein R2751_01910 [Bacteroidales bacterium]